MTLPSRIPPRDATLDIMIIEDTLDDQVRQYTDMAERARAEGDTWLADHLDAFVVYLGDLRDRLIAYLKQ